MEKEHSENPSEHLSNRACDACRAHKVRCLLNTSTASFPDTRSCLRCLKADRICVFTAAVKRKQRKRTDARVAELEKEVEAMRSLFGGKGKQGVHDTSNTDISTSLGGPSQAGIVDSSSLIWNPSPISPTATDREYRDYNYGPETSATSNFSTQKDVIERGILSWETAENLFYIYINDLFQHYPVVYFPPGTEAAHIRQAKPTLFLAVIAAASGKTDPYLFRTLYTEVLAAYAQRTVMNSEKSLELVQAQLCTATWYYSPGKYSRLKFYEYIHMATTMAIDIGLGTDPNPSKKRYQSQSISPSSEPDPGKSEENLEKRRTILICYIICAGVSMTLRRPNMLRSNKWIDDCVEYLSTYGSSIALDHTLVAWVKLLQITEEAVCSFSFDDIGNISDLAEPQVQFMLNGYQQKLLDWKEKFDIHDTINLALFITYQHIEIFLHELALHDDHPPAGMMTPYGLEKVVSILPEIRATSTHIRSISTITTSSHLLLDRMLHTDLSTLRSLPVFNYVRAAYTIVVLTKLHISSKSPNSLIGSVITPSIIKLGFYLESLIGIFGLAVGPMECRAPFTFLGLFMRLQIWYKRQEMDVRFKPPLDLYTVLDQCWLPPPPSLARVIGDTETPNVNATPHHSTNRIPGLEFQNDKFQGKQSATQPTGVQSLLNCFDFDWTTYDVNQFLNPDQTTTDPSYSQWIPPIDILNDPGAFDSPDWTLLQGDHAPL